MTAVTLPNATLKSGYITGEAWGVDMNRNLRVLDALVMGRVTDRGLTAPPGSPASGALYILGTAPFTGAWLGRSTGDLALWCFGDDLTPDAWTFITPKAGWRLYVADEAVWYQFIGGTWQADTTLGVNKYVLAFGNGSSGSFTFSHGLATRDVHVQVRRNSTPWDTLPEADYVCERPSDNDVQLSGFSLTPASNQWVVIIQK